MMSMRKSLLLFGLAACVLTVAMTWLLWPCTAITRENAGKIHVGMTRTEVETILGGPPRDETTGPFKLDAEGEGPLLTRWIDFMVVEPPAKRVMWHSDQVVIWVHWNEGCVHGFGHFPLRRRNESPLDTLRRWLHL